MRFTKETARRALRTFLQAFIPCFFAGLAEAFRDGGSVTWGAVIGLALPAIAAGLAALMNREADEDLPFDDDEEVTEDDV